MATQQQQQAPTASTMVCVRLRPPSARESGVRCIKAADDGAAVQFSQQQGGGGGGASAGGAYSLYPYDAVFGERAEGWLFGHHGPCLLAWLRWLVLVGWSATHTRLACPRPAHDHNVPPPSPQAKT
jgi:hypothetical protein